MALETDATKMLEGAAKLGQIRDQILAALGKYSTMNQNLTGPGFAGNAAMQSLQTTGDIQRTGQQVGERFGSVIATIKTSAHSYVSTDDDNRRLLGQVQA